MKLTFWLLDINPKIESGTVELQLWGIDNQANRILIIDRKFTAYFYAVLHAGVDAAKLQEAIMKSFADDIVKAEVVDRRFFGKPITAIKVSCRDATATGKVAKQLRSFEGITDCLEDDIRSAMRYLLDNDIVPCSWNEIDVIEEENLSDIRVEKIYEAKSPPSPIDKDLAPKLRTLAFSLICYSREGSPKPNRNPILILSTVTSNGQEKQFIANDEKDDKPLIQAFINYIRSFDPDIIVNYGANKVDWSYLRNRSHKLGMQLDFDRVSLEPHTSVYGHVSTTGIVNVDLSDFADMFPEVKIKTLFNFAQYLGVNKAETGIIEDVMFADYWDNKLKREELKKFGLNCAHSISEMATLLLDFAMQLSNLTSLPLDHVMTAATGFRVEWYLIKRAQKIGELIPRRLEQPYIPYAGGIVLSPKPGLHENIAVLDFKSMYPNIMINYNLSPDTYIAPNEPEPSSGTYIAPEVGHRFRKDPPGFYKEALIYLIHIRGSIRQKMKNLNSQTVQYQILSARQKAVKILTNAAYGYAGWIGARWYIKPVAEAASAWGRYTILTASQMAKDAGINVVYGDTDSLFINYNKTTSTKLQENIEHKLKLDVEVGEIYQRIFFTEAKKRYAGLRQDGTLDIVGLEVIRGDWAKVAKQVQAHILEIILKEQSPKKAIAYVHSIVTNLRQRKIPLDDLIIWKTLTKPPAKYAIKAPHVEAAKMLKLKGWRLTGGDKVGYVVLIGKGRLYNRVKPYIFATIEEVDVDYYITNQVLPAATRILGFFSITEQDLQKGEIKEETKSLTDFF